MPDEKSLLEFPCEFPIKIMGKTQDNYAQTVLDIVLRHAPDFDAATIEMRPSGKGNYVGLTCTINAKSRTQLDALYAELSSNPLVSFVL